MPAGTPAGSFGFVHVVPPSRETCTFPSSVPTQTTPAFTGDSAMVVMVPKCTTPSLRESMSLACLPKMVILSRSALFVRSGLTTVQVSPRSCEPKRRLPP